MFANKENIQMLWDVISDEHQFRFLPPDIQSSVYTLFIHNIPGFYENEKHKNATLVDINKKYILLIVSHIQKTYAHQPSKIKIHSDAPIHGLITAEDIQQERKTRINHEFTRRQEDFDDSMTLKAPDVPDFTDKHTDQPIKEMDKLLKEMHAQRNYEVAQINREYSPADKWLAPQETSLKPTADKRDAEMPANRLKHLPHLDLPKKSVTFNNDDQVNTFITEEDEEDLNVFAKLKKVNATVKEKGDDKGDDKEEDKEEDKEDKEEDKEEEKEEDHVLSKLERNVASLHEKMDRLIALFGARF